MNFRKDIYERVKYIMKEQSEMKVNCSKLGRQCNCDSRTVSRYVELAKNGEKPSQRVYQKKTDGFEHIIEEQPCGYNSVCGEYGMNKLKAEQYLQENVPNAYILRPPYFYGVYENLYREAFPFACAMLDRPFYIPQNGDMKLQFFNVTDLCRFVEILIDKRPKDHVFNVGNKDIVTVKEWVEL